MPSPPAWRKDVHCRPSSCSFCDRGAHPHHPRRHANPRLAHREHPPQDVGLCRRPHPGRQDQLSARALGHPLFRRKPCHVHESHQDERERDEAGGAAPRVARKGPVEAPPPAWSKTTSTRCAASPREPSDTPSETASTTKTGGGPNTGNLSARSPP